jgi:heme exporter protein D
MQWASWSDFFDMGGKGFYVWGSYLVSFAVFAIEIALVSVRRRRAEQAIREELEARNEATS